MMYFAWNPGTVVDEENRPLVAGRVSVYVHDSNVLANIYTMEGDEYIPAQNPQFLDDYGRLSATIFPELGVYDVKIEKNNGDDTFEDFDHFEIGIDAKIDDIGRDEVATIEDLANLDPDICSSVVTVTSYPRRNYIWDKDSTDTPDGGIVIDSDVKGEGNWILLWDCPYLPSSVYGVVDGDITNLNALLNYASRVGSFRMSTPPIIRFERGTYPLDYTYVSTKKMAFDPGVSFSGTLVSPCDVEMLGPRTYALGNIEFNGAGCTAHSSWYKNLDDFWHCGADILVVDNTNFFLNTTVYTNVALNGKTIIGTGTKVGTYANGAYFQLAIDSTVPDNFFIPSSDYVRITSTGFGDNVFRSTGSWDPGRIQDGHHIQFDQVPDLDLFQNANRWVSTMLERRNRLTNVQWANYTLDCQGRTVDSIYLGDSSFNVIQNATFTGSITCVGYGISLINVVASMYVNFPHAGQGTVALNKCRVSINRYHSGIVSLQAIDSDVSVLGAEGIDPCDTAINIRGGSFSGFVKMSTDNCNAYKLNNTVSFRDCFIADGLSWRLNYLQMVNCTSSGKIDLYPAAQGDKFYYNLLMEDNKLVGNFRLLITYYHDADHPHYECRGTAVKFNMMRIVNNSFDTNDSHAIKMTQWHIGYMESYMYTTFDDQNMGVWEYEGNSGNCPNMTPPSIDNYNNWTHHYEHPLGPAHYYRSNDNYYLFEPYDYQPGGSADSPNSMLDPSNPTNRVMALICEDGFDMEWTMAYVWYVNGLSTPENLEDEDYNNRFLCYAWLSKSPYSTDTANYNHNGFTTFNRCGKFA